MAPVSAQPRQGDEDLGAERDCSRKSSVPHCRRSVHQCRQGPALGGTQDLQAGGQAGRASPPSATPRLELDCAAPVATHCLPHRGTHRLIREQLQQVVAGMRNRSLWRSRCRWRRRPSPPPCRCRRPSGRVLRSPCVVTHSTHHLASTITTAPHGLAARYCRGHSDEPQLPQPHSDCATGGAVN